MMRTAFDACWRATVLATVTTGVSFAAEPPARPVTPSVPLAFSSSAFERSRTTPFAMLASARLDRREVGLPPGAFLDGYLAPRLASRLASAGPGVLAWTAGARDDTRPADLDLPIQHGTRRAIRSAVRRYVEDRLDTDGAVAPIASAAVLGGSHGVRWSLAGLRPRLGWDHATGNGAVRLDVDTAGRLAFGWTPDLGRAARVGAGWNPRVRVLEATLGASF